MSVICSWCGKELGTKKGKGISHGICALCVKAVEKEGKQIGGTR